MLSSCAGAQLTPEQVVARQSCYLAAETQLDLDVDEQCKGFTWAACPARPAIMAKLKAAQEACP